MAKVRVYEIARELNVDSKTLLARMKTAGIDAASHQSTLSGSEVEQVRGLISDGKAPAPTAEKKSAKPKVVIRRRRKAKEPEEPSEEAPAAEASPEEEAAPTPEETPTAAAAPAPADPAPEESQTVSAAEPAPEEGAAAPAPAEAPVETSEAPPEPVSAESESTESEPAAKKAAPKPSGGATIVRKATPEEVQTLEQQREAKNRGRTVRKEDSRGTRVTSLGLASERPEAPAGAGFDAPPPDGSPSRKRDSGTRKLTSEEELAEKKRQAAQKVRRANSSTNKRALLEQVNKEEDSGGFQGRTVYTPSASGRRRDFKRRKDLKKTQVTMPKAEKRIVKMGETITVGDLAKQLSVKAGELIKKLMADGVMATINQTVDFDTATLIANEYKYEVKSTVVDVDDILQKATFSDDQLVERPPIVTVMGHVDHGKTSILDAIREANVVSGEAGGITQHIGAYSVKHNDRQITFIDTPGHEAFSSMRARGAKVTDIVVLVVAADDGVMPQTVEAISHAKAAEVPLIVAVNKIDKPNTNVDRIYTELTEHGVQAEDWGGDTIFVQCSALEKIGLDDLLESILLQAEVLELRSTAEGSAEGVVVEAHLDKGRGPVATILVQQGTLRKGETLVAGTCTGKVRAMFNHLGEEQEEAGPSMPVEILGLDGVPLAGDGVNAVDDDKKAKDIVALRQERAKSAAALKSSASSLEDLLGKIQAEDRKEVPIIIKGDTQGSVEAVSDAVLKIESDKIQNRVVHQAVGGVSESDITLAAASGAIVIAFNVRTARGLDEMAEKEGVIIKYFSIIYDVVDAVKSVMAGRLPPITHEVFLGKAEVRQTIGVPKIGTIAGSSVIDGKIQRNSHCRVIRDDIVIYEGKLGSLRRFKDDVKEVQTGYECGIGLENYNDIKVGDVIEAFTIEEQAQTI